MSDSGKKRWLIKDREGRIRGPFYTDDILRRIGNGEFSGDEQISLYPGSDWIPISNDPTFYDQLLAFLEGDKEKLRGFTNYLTSSSIKKDSTIGSQTKSKAQTVNATPAQERKGRAESVEKKSFHDLEEEKKSANKQRGSAVKEDKFKISDKDRKPSENDEPVLELKKRKTLVKKAKVKKSAFPFMVLLLLLAGLLYLIFSESPAQGSRLRLLVPRNGQPAISAEKAKAHLQKALSAFVLDTYSSYVKAQNELVQVVEGNPRDTASLALLCMTYHELWPFAYQDSSDLYAVSQVTQLASQADPAGVEASTCRVVDFLIRGSFMEAKGATESVLETYSSAAQPPIAFYYFKALILEVGKDYRAATEYARSTQQLWPQWLRLFSFEADMLFKSGAFNEAANRYQQVLKSNPKHKVSQINLGIIEAKHLKNYDKGRQYLEMAIKNSEPAPAAIMSAGYITLAELHLQTGDSKKALDYAQEAYSFNTANAAAKSLIIQLGGDSALRKTKILDTQLVYEGDQFAREGDYAAAQAHYISAFETNKKNGVAAMKAAECLWKLSLATEAINWLNKAVKADPELVDAYILLADYYSFRHNYSAAGQVLAAARKQVPQSHKVLRGYAMVEYRRNNFAGAITYAQNAVKMYESDVDSYVILSRAQMKMGLHPQAYESANKAVEINSNSQDAQIVYAQSLANTRGIHVGIDYLKRMVNTYPTVTKYRMALAELYIVDQKYSSAQEIFDQVTRIEDKPKEAFVGLAKALQLQKFFDQALDSYFKAAALDPSDVEPLFLAGLLYLEVNKPSEARTQFQRVMRINADYPLVNYYIGKAAMQMNSPDEAIQQADLEKTKNPGLAEPYLLAAEAYTKLEQYTLCAEQYQKAIQVSAQNSVTYIKMARCYRFSGNTDAAVAMINQANTLESGNPEVWKEQGAIFEMKQEKIKAIEAYNQYLVIAPNAPDKEQIVNRINMLSR